MLRVPYYYFGLGKAEKWQTLYTSVLHQNNFAPQGLTIYTASNTISLLLVINFQTDHISIRPIHLSQCH